MSKVTLTTHDGLVELARFLLDNQCPSDVDGDNRAFTFELCEVTVIVEASKATGAWVISSVEMA